MDELKPIFLLIFSGLILRFALTFAGQAWAKSHAQTVSFMILPIITYIITKTISKKYQSLPNSCRSKVDNDMFKEELREHLVPKRYKFLARGSKIGCKLLTQIRVGRSYLNSHSYSVGKSLSPQCSCHFPTESTSHYVLDCFLYN